MSEAPPPAYLPSASLTVLQKRALLLGAVRRFFDGRDYWEVETPLLSHDIVIDAHLDPFLVAGPRGENLYLQTSPEFGMKRLLAAGATAIYQITRAFRQGECGRLHNPEFTMIEWYRTGDDHHAQMSVTEELVRTVFSAADSSLPMEPCRRLSYAEAFQEYAGLPVFQMATSELASAAETRKISVPPSQAPEDRDGWLNLLLAELVEPYLGQAAPEFLYDYPASQSALARIRPGPPAVAERFELYFRGVELCNGYHELTDPAELRRRNAIQQALRDAAGHPPLPQESRLLQAMDAGLPASAGVALGFDRLVMVALGRTSVAEVMAFPFERA